MCSKEWKKDPGKKRQVLKDERGRFTSALEHRMRKRCWELLIMAAIFALGMYVGLLL